MRFLFILLFLVNSVHGDLEDHLKIPLNKSDIHQMRNIDFIYLINLDERPEKLKLSLDQLAPFGIIPYRFSAVNGWKLSLEAINDIGLKFSPEMTGGFMGTSYLEQDNYKESHEIIQKPGKTYFCHCMARGTIGIAMSHISILQDAENSGYEAIWVMEDDIEVLKDPRLISDLIDQLDAAVGKENWDILFTDKDIRDGDGNHKPCYWSAQRPDFIKQASYNNYAARTPINSQFIQIGARYGATSMIVRKSGIKKLMQFFRAHQVFLPYDMEYILPTGIKLFSVTEDVVSNLPKALSDNGGPNYLTTQKD
jgi:GR25 family glycosyltransferase involved in LPS biosynthesis